MKQKFYLSILAAICLLGISYIIFPNIIENLINLFPHENVEINNQISVRNVKDVASNISNSVKSSNTTTVFNDSAAPSGWIIPCAVGGACMLSLGIYLILKCYCPSFPLS